MGKPKPVRPRPIGRGRPMPPRRLPPKPGKPPVGCAVTALALLSLPALLAYGIFEGVRAALS